MRVLELFFILSSQLPLSEGVFTRSASEILNPLKDLYRKFIHDDSDAALSTSDAERMEAKSHRLVADHHPDQAAELVIKEISKHPGSGPQIVAQAQSAVAQDNSISASDKAGFANLLPCADQNNNHPQTQAMQNNQIYQPSAGQSNIGSTVGQGDQMSGVSYGTSSNAYNQPLGIPQSAPMSYPSNQGYNAGIQGGPPPMQNYYGGANPGASNYPPIQAPTQAQGPPPPPYNGGAQQPQYDQSYNSANPNGGYAASGG